MHDGNGLYLSTLFAQCSQNRRGVATQMPCGCLHLFRVLRCRSWCNLNLSKKCYFIGVVAYIDLWIITCWGFGAFLAIWDNKIRIVTNYLIEYYRFLSSNCFTKQLIFRIENETNDMSMKNHTQLVVNCSNSNAKPLLESGKVRTISPTPKVPIRTRGNSVLANDENSCWSVKNPWLLRVAGVFALAVTIVVFAALHNKLRISVQNNSMEFERLQRIILTYDEKIKQLETR